MLYFWLLTYSKHDDRYPILVILFTPVTLHLAPSLFEKVQIGSNGAPEFWVILKSERPSGAHGSLTFQNYSTKSLLIFCTTGSKVSGHSGYSVPFLQSVLQGRVYLQSAEKWSRILVTPWQYIIDSKTKIFLSMQLFILKNRKFTQRERTFCEAKHFSLCSICNHRGRND